MTKFNYYEEVQKLLDNTSLDKSDVYYYDEYDIPTPPKEEFEEAFQFYQNNINDLSRHYDIENCILLFNTYRSMNAKACKENNYGIISINFVLIVKLAEMFYDNDELLQNNPKLASYTEFEKQLDMPIHKLMYEMALHFTFYHEFAHIVQFSALGNCMLEEFSEKDNEYSEQKHIYELDADRFSGAYLSSHLTQYNEKIFGKNINKENIEQLMVIFCSSFFLYMLSFRSNQKTLYFKDTTHPHPIIRNLRVVFTMVRHVEEILHGQGHHYISLNSNDIVDKTLEFSEELAKITLPEYSQEGYLDVLVNNRNDIIAYLREFDSMIESDKLLASNRRNEIAIKLHED